MANTTRLRLTEERVRTATADDSKHGRQLFDGLGSIGLYLHVTPAEAKCWVQQFMVPNIANGKSRRVRIGLGAWRRVTLSEARKATFANRCLRYAGRGHGHDGRGIVARVEVEYGEVRRVRVTNDECGLARENLSPPARRRHLRTSKTAMSLSPD